MDTFFEHFKALAMSTASDQEVLYMLGQSAVFHALTDRAHGHGAFYEKTRGILGEYRPALAKETMANIRAYVG